MRPKMLLDLFAMLLLLAFGPQENRHFFMDTPEDRFYGELLIYSDTASSWYLARNTLSQGVRLLDSASVELILPEPCRGEGSENHGPEEVCSQTTSIIKRSRLPPGSKQRVQISKKAPRAPRSLRIMTEAESFYGFVWPGVLLFLAVTLTYLISSLCHACDEREVPEAGPGESPS